MVSVGLLTLVRRLTGFSPGLESRSFSSPISPVSPGTLPGQTSRTRGFSASATAGIQQIAPASRRLRRKRFIAEDSFLLLFENPDVAELQRVAVSLQLDRAWGPF